MMRSKCCNLLLVLATLIAATLAQTEDVPPPPPLMNEISELNSVQNDTSTVLTPKGSRIVNGLTAYNGQFPYQARLIAGNALCGASIISDYYILTAAHCVSQQGLTASQINVKIGTNQLYGGGQEYTAESFYIHPWYSSQTIEFDVATRGRMQLGYYAQAITLPPSGYDVVSGTRGTIAGWGGISHGGPISGNLLYTNVPIVSNSQCQSVNPNRIHETMLCAGGGTTGACFGDSGGPLVANGMVVGVASWVIRCGTPPYYGGYAKVAHPNVIYWIHYFV